MAPVVVVIPQMFQNCPWDNLGHAASCLTDSCSVSQSKQTSHNHCLSACLIKVTTLC